MQLLQPEQSAHSSEPNAPLPLVIIRVWHQAAQIFSRGPVSSLHRLGCLAYVGHSFSGAYALSAVQCASREAAEKRAHSGDSDWHWHTSGGVWRSSNATFVTGSEQTWAFYVSFALLKSHPTKRNLSQIRWDCRGAVFFCCCCFCAKSVTSKCVLVCRRRRCPLWTKRTTLKVIIGRVRLIAWSRHLAGSSDPLWRVSGTERSCSDVNLCGRQREEIKNRWLKWLTATKITIMMKACCWLWLRCSTVSFLCPCCIFTPFLPELLHSFTWFSKRIPIEGHEGHILQET